MTMRSSLHTLSSMKEQRGVALLVALMFLIVLTLLGLAAIRGTTLEERMAGGSRDYNIALQAAEATLRDAENDLKGTGINPLVVRSLAVSSFPITFIGSANPSGCAAGGLCIIANETIQLYKNTSIVAAQRVDWTSAVTTARSNYYGQFTGAAALPGVAQQPRYILELMQFADGKNKGGNNGANDFYYVRITALAWGASTQTQVYLQEVFLVPLPT
jgi:type IV pilus assembly protein PilX